MPLCADAIPMTGALAITNGDVPATIRMEAIIEPLCFPVKFFSQDPAAAIMRHFAPQCKISRSYVRLYQNWPSERQTL
jgi:hypothetical protein